MLDALIGGPELALRYVQSLRQCAKDEWVDPLWADGGAVVDLDRRRVLFFGDELMVEMPARRAMMAVLAAVWPGYEIGWAYDGTAELAGYVGAELPSHTWDIRPELRPARDRNALCHLVSVVDAAGQVRFWPVCWHLSKAWHGPELMERLPGRGVRRLTLSKIPEGGVHIDVPERLWERGKPPTLWVFSTPFRTCGAVGKPSAGKTASRNRRCSARALCGSPSWTWPPAPTAQLGGSAAECSRALRIVLQGRLAKSRTCWLPSNRVSS